VRSPEPNREVFRLAAPLILWWVWLAFAVANVADFAIQGAPGRFAIVVSAILVAITGLAYALALRPRVIAEPPGLTIVNPFRDHHVPWAAITAVDTGDWVRVHYAAGQPRSAIPPSSAASKAVSCWALYVSARTKRRAARPPRPAPSRRSGLLRTLPYSSAFATPGPEPGYTERSRLPEEAKYLASLPPAKAIAILLDTRADRERARAAPEAQEKPVTARWSWPPIAAVVLPALALLIVLLA
jgi:Bacterial PH domain